MNSLFLRFAKDESGATAIEYGLIAGLISVVIIGGHPGRHQPHDEVQRRFDRAIYPGRGRHASAKGRAPLRFLLQHAQRSVRIGQDNDDLSSHGACRHVVFAFTMVQAGSRISRP